MLCEITHRCGHAELRCLSGHWAYEKERDAERLKSRNCTACAATAKRAASAVKAAAAREQLAGVRLPALSGSPRQVAWADDIRLEKLAALRWAAPAAVGPAAAVADARWWIDHRSASTTALVAAWTRPPPDVPSLPPTDQPRTRASTRAATPLWTWSWRP